jgi:peroxiredoxin
LSEERNGAVPLLLVAAALAVMVGAFVWWSAREGGARGLVGAPAPTLALPDAGGETVTLQELRGSVVFLNFWATWCAPCREEAPSLERLYTELRDEGFRVIAVTVDDPRSRSQVESFRDEFELSFPIVFDPEKLAYRAFGVSGLPETFLIAPDGRIVEHYVGPRDWGAPRYARAIRRLIAAHAEAEHG